MKNKELIDRLMKLPLDADIIANVVGNNIHHDWFDIVSAFVEKDQNTVIIEIA